MYDQVLRSKQTMVALDDFTTSVDSLVSEAVMGSLKTMLKSSPDATGHQLEYTVVNTYEDYEERWYPASTWVCTTVNSVYQDTAKIEGFRYLQAYARGGNKACAHLSMKPPIITRVCTESGDGFERRFVVCTYLTGNHSTGVPEPTSENVYIDHLPEMTVFVCRFQGIACEEKWTYETKHLAEILCHKEDIRTDFYITATYDSPFQLVSDRNEIWFVKIDRKKAKEESTDDQVLKFGDQILEVPSVFSWVLYFLLAYLSILVSLSKTAIKVIVMVRDNWSGISSRLHKVLRILGNNISFSKIIKTGLAVMLTMWSLALRFASGCTDTVPKKTKWPKRRNGKKKSVIHY